MGEADLVILIRMFEFYVLYLMVKLVKRRVVLESSFSREREKHSQFNSCECIRPSTHSLPGRSWS